jgi:hypothetical protein
MSLMKTFSQWLNGVFGLKRDDVVIDFADQLGLPIGEIVSAPDVLVQVLAGLQAFLRGEHDLGWTYLQGGLVSRADSEMHLEKLSGKHGFIYTEIVRLIKAARAVTKLPPVSWIEKHDPVVFELLRSVGQPATPVICAGIISHYLAEACAKRAINEPKVQAAERAMAQR